MRKSTKILHLFIVFMILLAATGCGKAAPPTPTVPPADTPAEKPSPTAAPQAANTPAATATVSTPQELQALLADQSPLAPQVTTAAHAIASRGSVEITFDQPMEAETTANAVSIQDSAGKAVAGKTAWKDPRILRFIPATPLLGGSTYQAVISTAARSTKGAALAEPARLHFLVEGDLQVSEVFPAAQTAGVDAKSTITVMFNRPVVALTTAEDQAKLANPIVIDPPTPGRGEWLNTSVFVYHPSKALAGGQAYTVTIKAGLQDALGEGGPLPEDFTWTFTTAAPTVESIQVGDLIGPENGVQNIALDAKISVTFHQPMDTATLDNVTILAKTGAGVSLLGVWDATGSILTLTPTTRLAYAAQYTLTVSPQAQAASGGKFIEPYTFTFNTVKKPAVVSTDPSNGSQNTNAHEFSIYFASPMRLESLTSRVTFNPPLPAAESDSAPATFYNERDHVLTFFGLAPSTTYTVSLAAGMEDLYGAAIPVGSTVRFTTAASDPWAYLLMPWQAVYRADGPLDFNIQYVNINSYKVNLYLLKPEDYPYFLKYGDPTTYAFPKDRLAWSYTGKSTGKLNETVIEKIRLGGGSTPMAQGLYILTMQPIPARESEPPQYRLLAICQDNITLKNSPGEALLWLTNLTSGQPVNGVPLGLYDQDFHLLGQATTASDGLARLTTTLGKEQYVSFAMSTDPQRFSFTSLNWGSGVSPYQFGIADAYYTPAMPVRSYLYSDRPIYRPGQPVYFKGIVRLDDDLQYSLPKFTQVEVTISNFKEKVTTLTLPLSSYGTFDGKWILDSSAAVGPYSIQVRLPAAGGAVDEQPALGYLSFNVAEYRRPEFQVTVTAEPKNLLPGGTITSQVDAAYYSGGKAAGSKVSWTLQAVPFTFTPPELYQAYSFVDNPIDTGERTFYPAQPDTRLVASGEGVTDASGHFAKELPAEMDKTGNGQAFTFEATVIDSSNNAVADRANVTMHASSVYAGIRPRNYVGVVGEKETFELVALDWDGKALPGQVVDVEIFERQWYSVQKQDAQGNLTWETSVKEVSAAVFSGVKADSEGKLSVDFTPTKGGIYAARSAVKDAHGNTSRSSTVIWVAGKEYIPWRQTNDRSFQVVADKTSYAPGDTARILIASPFQGTVTALLTVERGHTRSAKVIELSGNSLVYSLPITADMAPDVFFTATVIKGVDDTNPRPNFKIGMVKLKVSTDAQALQVKVTADRTQAGPGDRVTYQVQVHDLQGKPVRAEVSLSLSDLATLTLAAPNASSLMDYFYAPRDLQVNTSIGIIASVEDFNAALKPAAANGARSGSGGGKGSGYLGVVDVRQNFPDTPFWEAHLETGPDGLTSVTVTLPDNLTIWRMDARAVTQATMVGQASADIVSSKDLLVRPQTPRFFVAGDTAAVGAAVQNNTKKDLEVVVTITAEGLAVDGSLSQTVSVPAGLQKLVTWNGTVAADAERVDLVLSAQSGDLKDSSRPMTASLENGGLPVYHYEALETVGTSGVLRTGGARVEGISLPASWNVTQGSLTLELSPSLAAGLTDGLAFLEHYPYECIEQTISRFLPNVITTRALKTAGVSDPALEANLKKEVDLALQKLSSHQNADGGWGWWSGSQSDSLTSAYVILGLLEAKAAGYAPEEGMLARAVEYLQQYAVSFVPLKSSAQSLSNRQAFLFYILARAGQSNNGYITRLFDLRQTLSIYSEAYLALAIQHSDPADPRLKTLVSDLISAAALSATGAHWEEKNTDPWNWNTDLRSTAIVLDALIHVDPNNDLNANAVRWLMSNRSGGYWKTTQETAWTLIALSDWMAATGEMQGKYQFAAAFNGEQATSGVVTADTIRDNQTVLFDVSGLLTDQANRLAVARTDGPGTLYYTARLNVSLPVDKIAALDRGFSVARQYFLATDLEHPVSSAKAGDLLLARMTVVVPDERHYVVVDDPLPAGLEIVDTSLDNSTQSLQPEQYDWNSLRSIGWGWWYFNHVEMRDNKVVLSADILPAGTYVYTYYVRAVTPGSFHVIPVTAQEFYFSEVYGRGDGSTFTVLP